MSKITCDICGTTYQDTADQCPICGCTRDAAAALLSDAVAAEEAVVETAVKANRFASKKKEIFDFDEVNDPAAKAEEEDRSNSYDDEEEDEEDRPRHNTFVVILLTILIVGLLAVAGFLFVRYFLPNMMGSDETTAPATEVIETTAAPTTELTIPCQTLVMTSGAAQLSEAGQYFLVHVIAMPEDTTDKIVYASGDESIATVTEDGRITAVAEGETVIYITCGNQQMVCPVVCEFVEETTAPETNETGAEETTGEETDETTGEETDENKDAEAEETEATEAVDKSGVTLKLKKTDITLPVYLQFTLVLDCDLEPTDVEWSSEHPHIATVDENGVVTAKKYGTTIVTAKYGSQEVDCWVRCVNN